MRKRHLTYLLLFAQLAFCQWKIKPTYCPGAPLKPYTIKANDTIYMASTVTVQPEFEGGLEAFYKAFDAAFRMPAQKPELKNRLLIGFVVSKDGQLSDIKVLNRDLKADFKEEAIRTLESLPLWKPAQHHGKKVCCGTSVAIKLPYEPGGITASRIKFTEISDKQ